MSTRIPRVWASCGCVFPFSSAKLLMNPPCVAVDNSHSGELCWGTKFQSSGFMQKHGRRPPVKLDLAMTAIGIEGRGHQAAAVLPEVEDRAVGSADRNAVRPRAHHL